MKAAVYKGERYTNEIVGLSVDSVKKVPRAKIIGAPIETGQTAFDHKVVEPFDLIVIGTITCGTPEAKSAIADIDWMIENKKFQFCSVCDGFRSWDKLSLVEAPAIRDTKEYDWINVELKFTNVMLVQGAGDSVSNSDNSNFCDGGYTQGTEV